MPFGSYKTFAEAIRGLQVTELREEFVEPLPVPVSDYFRAELELTLSIHDVECSEAAVCENLLYPILREAIKPQAGILGIWSHAPLYKGNVLLGYPDYVIGKRSPLSNRVMEQPLAMIMEAKRNDFDAGWAQCLAAMAAAQEINGQSQGVVFGGVSDGFHWQFAKLVWKQFAKESFFYELKRLDELIGALHYVLTMCRQQVLAAADAA